MHANKARFGDWEADTIIGAQHKAGSRIIFHISFDIFSWSFVFANLITEKYQMICGK
jgi:hypothetical protein